MTTNPFSEDYFEQEVSSYGLLRYDDGMGLTIVPRTIQGRCDDYLNVNMRFSSTEFPTLMLDGRLWMSLTPMELQSLWVPIQRASGNVFTAGLGLGYFALRVAAKPEVETVTVVEREHRVIKMFRDVFNDRPGYDKISIIPGDIRALSKRWNHPWSFTFGFMDVYDTLLGDDALEDAIALRTRLRIHEYRFWGMEKLILYGARRGLNPRVKRWVDFHTMELFRLWTHSELSRLREVQLDQEYLQRFNTWVLPSLRRPLREPTVRR